MKWNEMKWNEMKWNEMKWNEMKSQLEPGINILFVCYLNVYVYCIGICYFLLWLIISI